jgi:hypothetical protein
MKGDVREESVECNINLSGSSLFQKRQGLLDLFS